MIRELYQFDLKDWDDKEKADRIIVTACRRYFKKYNYVPTHVGLRARQFVDEGKKELWEMAGLTPVWMKDAPPPPSQFFLWKEKDAKVSDSK